MSEKEDHFPASASASGEAEAEAGEAMSKGDAASERVATVGGEPSQDEAKPQDAEAKPLQEPDAAAPLAGPSFLFMAVLSASALIADAVSKYWAETTLSALPRHQPNIVLVEDVLSFQLAYNKGGAFGMLSGEDDSWRGPFFLLISVAAVAFIVSLYRRVAPQQWALKWGLPLVLGGALGNLADRIAKGRVVDFVDYQAGWVRTMNEAINSFNSDWHVTSHWPTFNVADMCICVGVGLMAIDMFTSSRQTTAETSASDAKAAES